MNEFFKNYLEKKGFNFYKKIETLQINIINLEDELFDELIEKFNLKDVAYADVLGCNEAVQVAAIGTTKNNKEILFIIYLSDYPYQEYSISYILEGGEYAPLAENNSAKEELSPEEYKREEKYLSPKNPLTINMVEDLWEKL